jgi:cytidyltransferase-like protein
MEEEKESKKPIVVVASGYFDPLHVGHLECFELAKKLGDKLVVIMNNDEQIRLKKGKAFMPQDERKKILEALRDVDEVFVSIDTDKSVCKSIEAVRPDIFAKGGDRFAHEIPEREVCERIGCKIVDSLGEKIQSSASLTGLTGINELGEK